jgi:hypothetical protein
MNLEKRMPEVKALIPAVDRELLKAELSPERFLRYTNNGDNIVYVVNYHNAPNVVREIGRLRELTFRAAGGGTGMELDLDENEPAPHSVDEAKPLVPQ